MNKKKILMYNGGKDSYQGCSDPNLLVKGQLYEVIIEKDLGFQTNYFLKGTVGEFNSVWFNEPTSYFSYSTTIPVVGKPMEDIIRFEGIVAKSIRHTSVVSYIESISSDTYKAYTKNTLYIVKVLSKS